MKTTAIGLACFSMLAAGTALAQAPTAGSATAFPNRFVRIVYPQTPGIGYYLRVLADKLTEEWGQQVIIDYRAGANGIVGVQQVSSAKPDGHTILASYASPMVINPHVYKSLPYDVVRDFAPIAQVVTANMGLVVHPKLPVRSVKELVALAKARPGDLMYGSNGVGNMTHLAGELFAMEAGINILHVPYKGGTPSIQETIGGQVQMLIANTSSYLPHVDSGRLRLLAICSEKRSSLLQNTPTMVESGYPRLVMTAWGGLLAPTGTPRDIIMKIYRDTAKAVQLPEVRERFLSFGNEVEITTPEEFGAFLKADLDRWGRVVKHAGIEHSQ
jgi:tripartite-type tricarboxylate transporter receptor subunit TctC